MESQRWEAKEEADMDRLKRSVVLQALRVTGEGFKQGFLFFLEMDFGILKILVNQAFVFSFQLNSFGAYL